MKYQLAHPRFFMAVSVILALSGVALVVAGIESVGDTRLSYSTNFGGYTQNLSEVFSGGICG